MNAIKIIDEMIQELHKNDGVYGTGYLDLTKINLLEEVKKRISSLPSDTQGYTKKEVLDFAYWYHNGLLNRDRGDVEVEFDDFIKYHRKGLIPNKIIGN